jgi:hypothetical protein
VAPRSTDGALLPRALQTHLPHCPRAAPRSQDARWRPAARPAPGALLPRAPGRPGQPARPPAPCGPGPRARADFHPPTRPPASAVASKGCRPRRAARPRAAPGPPPPTRGRAPRQAGPRRDLAVSIPPKSRFNLRGPLVQGMEGWRGEGRIRATRGWISVDRGSKATLPLTIPRRVFKSSAKDSTRRPTGMTLRGGRAGASAGEAAPPTRAHGSHEGSYCGTAIGRRDEAPLLAGIPT